MEGQLRQCLVLGLADDRGAAQTSIWQELAGPCPAPPARKRSAPAPPLSGRRCADLPHDGAVRRSRKKATPDAAETPTADTPTKGKKKAAPEVDKVDTETPVKTPTKSKKKPTPPKEKKTSAIDAAVRVLDETGTPMNTPVRMREDEARNDENDHRLTSREQTARRARRRRALARCGTPCAGVFESQPGGWGPRRLPLQINAYRS